MKVLVLGIGLQGKAAVFDLEKSPLIKEIVAADLDQEAVNGFIAQYDIKKSAGRQSERG